MDRLKLSINLEIPKEPEYKQCVCEKAQDCMEQVEYGNNPEAYNYLRNVLNFATKCYREGKRSDKLHKLLGMLTPFMARYGLEDHRGLEMVEGYVTNPDYREDTDEQ